MRRVLALVLMLPLLLLCACGGGESKELRVPMEFRAALQQAEAVEFTSDIRVDLEDQIYDLTLQCRVNADGSAELTVLAPETVAGIQATLEAGQGRLRFDGLAVDFGLLPDGESAPIELPALLTALWKSGWILAAGPEDGQLRVSYEDDTKDGGLTAEVWFADELPVFAELARNGLVFASLRLTDLRLDGG